jgi:hypothetical protein
VSGVPKRTDEVLREWDHFRFFVSFRDFPDLVGMTYTAWERMFLRARNAGDPRAVRVYDPPPSRPVAPCGTRAAYARHLYRGEKACAECLAANAAATRVVKERHRRAKRERQLRGVS